MNLLISESYRELNTALHNSGKKYGESGHQWADKTLALALSLKAKSVLDYGCGKCTLGNELLSLVGTPRRLPFDLYEYDPAVEGKGERPPKADIVVCTDVLEHVEPECLYPVLDDIKSIARLGVLLAVATTVAKKQLADGRNAHLIVEPSHWWLPKLMSRWRIQSFCDFGPGFAYIGVTM